jgi:hypothetical protein
MTTTEPCNYRVTLPGHITVDMRDEVIEAIRGMAYPVETTDLKVIAVTIQGSDDEGNDTDDPFISGYNLARREDELREALECFDLSITLERKFNIKGLRA